MRSTTASHASWVAPSPLWSAAAATPEVLRRPTILGYPHDHFMEELLAQLAQAPAEIAARVATGQSPSFRERQPGEPYGAASATAQLKLYQPGHGWFYLVVGSLVCQLPGLPDHALDLAAGDESGFVLRRLQEGEELALVGSESKAWRPLSDPSRLAPGEELLPLFPLCFRLGDHRRRVLAGMIPAGSQDALQAAPLGDQTTAPSDGKPPPADALEEIQGRVTRAIERLHAQPPPSEQATEVSRFVLLDLADFLAQRVPAAWRALTAGGTATGAAGRLVSFLREHGVEGASYAALLKGILTAPLSTPFEVNLARADVSLLPLLDRLLQAALEEEMGISIAAVPVEVQDAETTRYVTRLIYRRPQCGPAHPEVVSSRSEPFVLAPYFDPDAPARPVRIALPFDASIKGLRQFRKSVKLVLSDALRQKVKGIGDLGGIQGPGFDCGGIALSIPIITICAMIILFVFLNLLNIVFWWLPFVKICFPKLKVGS